MERSTVMTFMQAYNLLQEAVKLLYAQSESCVERENYVDASLLEAKADKLFEEADSILLILSEQSNG